MQYGVWLKGEPGRRVGNDQGKSKGANRSNFRQNREEMTARMQVQELVWQEVREGVSEGHVIGQMSNQRPGQIYNLEEIRVACQAAEINHENGKTNLLQEKGEEGLDIRRMNSLTGTLPIAELEGDML